MYLPSSFDQDSTPSSHQLSNYTLMLSDFSSSHLHFLFLEEALPTCFLNYEKPMESLFILTWDLLFETVLIKHNYAKQ